MTQKRWIVELTKEEREELLQIVNKGKGAAYKIKHANILLKADQSEHGEGWADERISEAFHCQYNTVYNVRKRFVEEGLQSALGRKNRENYTRKLDGEQEAKLTLLACSDPPEGHCRWTMVLLADKMVELEIVESISPSTIHRTLKKTKLSPGK